MDCTRDGPFSSNHQFLVSLKTGREFSSFGDPHLLELDMFQPFRHHQLWCSLIRQLKSFYHLLFPRSRHQRSLQDFEGSAYLKV